VFVRIICTALVYLACGLVAMAERDLCSSSCAAHGTCTQGVCQCDANWSGQDCGYFLASTEAVDEDDDAVEEGHFQESPTQSVPASELVAQEGCPEKCGSPGGRCVSGNCVCELGFFGPSCQDQQCSHDCFGHGVCSRGICECAEGWFGRSCSSRLDAPQSCEPACINGGQCVEGHCVCSQGFSGADCSVGAVLSAVANASLPSASVGAVSAASAQGAVLAGSAAPGLLPAKVERAAGTLRAPRYRASGSARKGMADPDHEDSSALPGTWPLPTGSLPHQLQAELVHHGEQKATAPKANTSCVGNCSGHGECSLVQGLEQCACHDGWIGATCDMLRCPGDCAGRGVCVQGRCVCEGPWYGEGCQHHRCPDDCSGTGYCFDGKCHCNQGFHGTNCADFSPVTEVYAVHLKKVPLASAPPAVNRFLESATLRGMPPQPCPGNCSSRGTCSDQGECQCFTGFSGPSCEWSCPGECSHQGSCVQGACLCFSGFLGADCSESGCCSGHGTCDDPEVCVCEPGWGGNDCSVRLLCPTPDCAGHGDCKDGVCHCKPGFLGLGCAEEAGGCPAPCGNHGMCNPATKTCDCEEGFVGSQCQVPLRMCPNHCNNKGLCLNGLCMCGEGWVGEDCGQPYFSPGVKASDLVEGDSEGINRLSGPSTNFSEVGRVITSGEVCGEGGLCSGHGTCDTTTGRCICEKTYTGDTCEIGHCPGFLEAGEDCHGHGLCFGGKCQCEPGWGLLEGSTELNACQHKVCASDCGSNGECVGGECRCKTGWTGPTCREPHCPLGCAHGRCTLPSLRGPGECLCDDGWVGASCERQALFTRLRSCANDCSGNGLCMDGHCACNVGFTGADCSSTVCPPGRSGPDCNLETCPNDCSGKGLCMNGQCTCWEAFVGKDCSIPDHCVGPCASTCGSDGSSATSEQCTSCVGQCVTVQDHPLGFHSVMKDLQATLLQARGKAGPPAAAAASVSPGRSPEHRRHREILAQVIGQSGKLRHSARRHREVKTPAVILRRSAAKK